MSNLSFSIDLARQLYNSAEQFPVDFDDAYQWLDFSNKSNAKRSFFGLGFVEGADFQLVLAKSSSKKGGRPSQKIYMTIDCFSSWKASSRPKPKRTEESYRNKLATQLNGMTEVWTEAGAIDILTTEEIIEVKKACGWKEGIGQLMVYGEYYRSHKKRLHLFGTCHETFLVVVQKHCNKRRIALTWEP